MHQMRGKGSGDQGWYGHGHVPAQCHIEEGFLVAKREVGRREAGCWD